MLRSPAPYMLERISIGRLRGCKRAAGTAALQLLAEDVIAGRAQRKNAHRGVRGALPEGRAAKLPDQRRFLTLRRPRGAGRAALARRDGSGAVRALQYSHVRVTTFGIRLMEPASSTSP